MFFFAFSIALVAVRKNSISHFSASAFFLWFQIQMFLRTTYRITSIIWWNFFFGMNVQMDENNGKISELQKLCEIWAESEQNREINGISFNLFDCAADFTSSASFLVNFVRIVQNDCLSSKVNDKRKCSVT